MKYLKYVVPALIGIFGGSLCGLSRTDLGAQDVMHAVYNFAALSTGTILMALSALGLVILAAIDSNAERLLCRIDSVDAMQAEQADGAETTAVKP